MQSSFRKGSLYNQVAKIPGMKPLNIPLTNIPHERTRSTFRMTTDYIGTGVHERVLEPQSREHLYHFIDISPPYLGWVRSDHVRASSCTDQRDLRLLELAYQRSMHGDPIPYDCDSVLGILVLFQEILGG